MADAAHHPPVEELAVQEIAHQRLAAAIHLVGLVVHGVGIRPVFAEHAHQGLAVFRKHVEIGFEVVHFR